MKLSVNEFEGGVRKAAVGAGLGWGLGDALAAACREVAAAGGDGVAAAIWAVEDGAALTRAAPSAFDRAAAGDACVRIAHQGRPALLTGYAAAASRAHGCGFAASVTGDTAVISLSAVGAALPPPPRRIEVDAQVWARIVAHGARTLVPSSARSRAEGAGAGLVDRD